MLTCTRFIHTVAKLIAPFTPPSLWLIRHHPQMMRRCVILLLYFAASSLLLCANATQPIPVHQQVKFVSSLISHMDESIRA